ncbi:trypsin-like serine protease [Lentzea sp. NPDC042327]|uniref:trypsin-like serine protease n=1 Tax=Lentzea sp. NPDC042327 TaxID=3154801 RepID=UPI0033F28352
MSSNGSASTPTTAYQLCTTLLEKPACAAADISQGDLCANNSCRRNGVTGGACNGDSGGPIYLRKSGRDLLVGVVSRGGSAECGASPDAATRTASIAPWITAVRTGRIDTTVPLTAAQGGPIPHHSITFTTTPPLTRAGVALAG